jgi:general secretion pathway protein I
MRARGFTLLEVLIAIAVVALALTALVRATGQQADALARERELTLATWVAEDALTELRLREPFPSIGQRTGHSDQAGSGWRWRMAISATDQPAVRRIELGVYHEGAESGEQPIVTLTGFAGQP